MEHTILIGFMGAGKTTLGKRVAAKLQKPFEDTDLRIEKEQGRPISDIFAKEGEQYFRMLETKQLEELLKEKESCVLSVGGGLPVQEANPPLLKQLGKTIYLKASKETLVKRLQGDKSRPLLQGGQLEEKIESLMAAREHIYEQVADVIVETDHLTMDEMVDRLITIVQGEG